MSPKETEVCRRQLQDFLEKGMIEEETTPPYGKCAPKSTCLGGVQLMGVSDWGKPHPKAAEVLPRHKCPGIRGRGNLMPRLFARFSGIFRK